MAARLPSLRRATGVIASCPRSHGVPRRVLCARYAHSQPGEPGADGPESTRNSLQGAMRNFYSVENSVPQENPFSTDPAAPAPPLRNVAATKPVSAFQRPGSLNWPAEAEGEERAGAGAEATESSQYGKVEMSRGAGRLEPWLNYVSHDDRTLYYNTQVTSYPTSLIQLRDSCACARCVDPHSKQRNFRTSDIPLDIGVEKLFSRGKMLQVLWKNDIPGYEYHSSRFSKEDLMDLHAEHPKRWNRGGLRIPWNKEIFTRNQTWVSFNDFLHNNESFAVAMRALRRYGLIFVKDIPERNTSIEMLATKMGPLRNSFYGLTWDVRSQHNAHNVAYTNKFLGFHMDLLYMADPPGFQLLHCMRNSLAGGESLFSDTHRAVHALMEKEPELYNILCRFPVRFGYHNGGQQYEYSRTVIERPFPNRVPSLFSYVNYSPPFQLGMVKPKPMGRWSSDGVQRLFVDAMKCFAEELEDPKNMFEMKMNPGECVIFDNRRVVHARNAFQVDSGQPSLPGGTVGQGTARWLRGAYVDEDALLSKFDLLRYHNIGWWDSTNPSDGAWLGQMEWNASPEAIEQWKQESEVLQVKREGEFRRAQQP